MKVYPSFSLHYVFIHSSSFSCGPARFIHSFIYLHSIESLQGLINTTIRYRISQVTHHALQIKQLSKYIVP
jgi:hypothetical protein